MRFRVPAGVLAGGLTVAIALPAAAAVAHPAVGPAHAAQSPDSTAVQPTDASSTSTSVTTSVTSDVVSSSATSSTSAPPPAPPAPVAAPTPTVTTTAAVPIGAPAVPGPPTSGPSGTTGPAAIGSSATSPDDGTLFSSGPASAGGVSAPGSAAASGGTQAPPPSSAASAIAAAASAAAASANAITLPDLPFNGVLALSDPFASVADSVLGYFRIPLFLLPIYQAAGDQYGVPWQVLAAINEIETDYGHDLGVSSAGALGWMQFEPATWLLYGLDATASGAADPYNPADAIFAAARLLRDAGARTNLSAAILSYNHSTAYVDSVLLRAELIEAYPPSVIDGLTALSIGDVPVHNGDVRSVIYGPRPHAIKVPADGVAKPDSHKTVRLTPPAALTLVTTPGARVLAVRDGRVVHEGVSPSLGGQYLTLRDADGNYFTYGHLSRRAVYGPEHPPQWHPLGVGTAVGAGAVIGEVGGTDSVGLFRFAVRPAGDREPVDPLPYLDSWALRAETLAPLGATTTPLAATTASAPITPALAAAGALGTAGLGGPSFGPTAPAVSRVVTAAVAAAHRAKAAQRARAQSATDLFSWGSTTIFFVTAGALEHAVLVNRHLRLPECERALVASHRVDRRVLAVLEYLAQSGFSLTVDPSSCTTPPATGTTAGTIAGAPAAVAVGGPTDTTAAATAAGAAAVHSARLGSLDIADVNGNPVAAHPSAASLTGLVLARLRALYGEFVPQSVLDLASATTLVPRHGGPAHELQVSFAVGGTPLAQPPAPAQAAAASVSAFDAPLTTLEWSRVTSRLAAITSPALVPFPSPNATVDPASRRPR